jgi:GntR family transcriptional regulator
MGLRHVSADKIRRTLLSRINSGQYRVGSRIPPARALASEFGANRNTVNKAFQELAREGVVTLVPGRGGGTFVERAEASAALAVAQVQQALGAAIEQARDLGLSKRQLSDLTHRLIDEQYSARTPRVKFLECNVHDAHTLVQQLQPLVACSLEPGVIDDENIGALPDRYDLIVTTFHHLAEVSRALDGQHEKVIGVNAVPTTEVALKIARLEARRLGLVCGRENTVQSMKYLVASYHPDDELEAALVDDTEHVRRLARTCEALIVTYSSASAVERITDRPPDIVIEFQIDGQSIEYVRQRIAQLQGEAVHAH